MSFFKSNPLKGSKQRKNVRFLILSDRDDDIRHWEFPHTTVIAISVVAIILCSSLLFTTSDLLTQFLYKSRLDMIKEKNRSMANLVLNMQDKLHDLESELFQMEEKDRALRTYANLPAIDKDVRLMGIGGSDITKNANFDELLPEVETKISKLELDLENLGRQVKLEKESFESIYKTVLTNMEKLASIPSTRPVNGGYLNTGFGYRKDPFTRERRFHFGQDFSAPKGTAVYASADGKIGYTGYYGSHGKTIRIDHGSGYQTFYSHLSRILAKSGNIVKRGDLIGEVGNTGRSTAPHLHYEVHYNGLPQDPQNYFLATSLR